MALRILDSTTSGHTPLHPGYHHTIRHLGYLFQVQTEDGGEWIASTCFSEGAIIASVRTPRPQDDHGVRALMQHQHKGVLRALRDGTWDEKIRCVVGQRLCEPSSLSDVPVLVGTTLPVTQNHSMLAFALPPRTPPELPAAPTSPPAAWPTMVMPAAAMDLVNHALSAWRNASAGSLVGTSAPVRHRLVASFPDADTFMRATYRTLNNDGLVVRSPDVLEAGWAVMVDLRFAAGPVPGFVLRGRIAWLDRVDGVTAAGVELAPDEGNARIRLLGLLSGHGVARLTPRRPANIPVELRGHALHTVNAVTADLSEGGVFIKTNARVQAGQVIRVRLLPSGTGPVDVDAVVASQRSGVLTGLGARFLYGSLLQMRQVRDVLAALAGPAVKAA